MANREVAGKRGFWAELRALIRNHRKGLLITFGSFTLVFVLSVGFLAHESAKPEFCTTCHIMEPYYESWKTSSHNNVNCLTCHFEPGLKGFVRGKVVALSQFVRYITVTYGSKPWAEIPDKNCQQPGCHEGADLRGPMEYRQGIVFDHSHHMQNLRRGKDLRCTSCHSQIVQGSHMRVTGEVCYICHFKPLPNGELDPKLSDCRTCHVQGVSTPLAPQEHALFIDRGTDCEKCHFNVIRGNGEVLSKRCETCHADPEHLEETSPEKLHKLHVSDHKVECFECHNPIEHTLESVHDIAQADCGLCHAERHQLQKAFYEGSVAVPIGKPHPSPMIEAHIACSGCHSEMETEGPTTSPVVLKGIAHASGQACDYCHGSGYDNLLDDWLSETDRRITQIRGLTRISESVLEPVRPSIKKTAEDIDLTLAVVEKARPVHNIAYAATLIDHSQSELLNATSQTAVGETVRDFVRTERRSFDRSPSCLQKCHYGIEHRRVFLKNQNRLFNHAPHVNMARLDCGTCHSREQHKVSLPRGYDCIGCHHEKAAQKSCLDCHQETHDFAAGGFAGYDIASEQNQECEACHRDNVGNLVLLNTAGCRECHLDDKAYIQKLEAEQEDLKTLEAEVNELVDLHWDGFDHADLRLAERARTVQRINGIHNYHLSKKLLQDVKVRLSDTSSTSTASLATQPLPDSQ